MGKPIDQFRIRLDKATASRSAEGVPNVAVIAADANGTLLQKLESGKFLPHARNPTRKSDNQRQDFTADTVCWIASCTKLMTTVAVMQCVEKKLLNLEEDIAESWLPEFKEIDILIKIEEDADGKETLKTKKAQGKVTLRNLLTHSSGVAYEFTHPKLNAWRFHVSSTPYGKAANRSAKIEEALRVPLLFEPGTAWVYGYGIDWAGLAVMRATSQTLEDYMVDNIWNPLGMRSTTFSLDDHRPDLWSRMAGMTERAGDGSLEDTDGGVYMKSIERIKYGGGGGCFSTANDYIKLLVSLLNTATQPVTAVPQVLTKESLDEMFTPKLSDATTASLRSMISNPMAFGLAGNLANEPVSFGLGGILNLGDVPKTNRSKGAMQWGGLPNLFWWISPGDNTCGCYFGQILPPGDILSFELLDEFERAVLEEKRLATKGKL